MPRFRSLIRLLIVLAAFATPGCGGGNQVKVSGKLLKGGAKYVPPEGQRIRMTLIAIEAKDAAGKPVAGEPFVATLDPDGESFTVPGREGYGIHPGKYRIAVTQRMTREALEANPPGAKPGRPPVDRDTDFLEDKFGPKTSPIIREIRGTSDLVIDLDRPTEGGPGA